MSGRNGTGPETETEPRPTLPVGNATGELDELGPLVEFGRYQLREDEAGLVLARKINTCERCQGCGCGDRVDALLLPDPRRGRSHMMAWFAANMRGGMMATISRMVNGADGGE
jgi:hypothetical protein